VANPAAATPYLSLSTPCLVLLLHCVVAKQGHISTFGHLYVDLCLGPLALPPDQAGIRRLVSGPLCLLYLVSRLHESARLTSTEFVPFIVIDCISRSVKLALWVPAIPGQARLAAAHPLLWPPSAISHPPFRHPPPSAIHPPSRGFLSLI
jgi:hypothetical protein